MTYHEFTRWCAYRQKRGPLNALLRADYNFAQIAMLIVKAASGKDAKLQDFLMWGEAPEPTIEDVAQVLGVKRG